MKPAGAAQTDIVLVGGGHAHALLIRSLGMTPLPGARFTLVSPASHTPYSGMLPGLVAGHYTFDDAHIDLVRLCQWAGVRFIAAEAEGLDPQARSIAIAGRPPLRYDVVSLDIGSQPELDSVPGAREVVTPVKPVATFWARWQALLERLDGGSTRIALVGGGAGGVELVLAMARKLAGRDVTFTLVSAGPDILDGYHPRARKHARRALENFGVRLITGQRVTAVESGRLHTSDGTVEGLDEIFWCTAAAPAAWLADTGLDLDDRGFIALRDTLQSVSHDSVFAAGDVGTQVNYPRPKAGVYAVRQAPVLFDNLRALLAGNPLNQHHPQKRFLSLLSLGEQRAVAERGPLCAAGRWAWRWKDHIDREFMGRFSDLPASEMGGGRPAPEAQAPCGGCGAKLAGDILASTLRGLRERYPGHCLPGDVAGEDVAPIPGAGGVVQSVDMLRSLVDDPHRMGAIAAQHALSDLYASGVEPVSALAVITLPFAAPSLHASDLEQVLDGALSVLAAADCPLLGGHSMQGPELQLGFVVNGRAPQEGPLSKRGAQPGDRLILTGALGSGALFAAHMLGQADGRDILNATQHLLSGNRAAIETARQHAVRAATDVTGFGLAGHLLEMLDDSLGVRVDLSALPLLPGAEVALQAGIRSTMHEANQTAFGASVQADSDDASPQSALLRDLLFDPQTGGGLLLALPVEQVTGCSAALTAAGVPSREIGVFTDAHAGSIVTGAAISGSSAGP